MKGDFSKDTFDSLKHFSRVLQQQGRVQLDADTNEQAAILLHYLRTLVTDLIGPYAGPEGLPGFEVGPIENGDFSIGKGRYYVDGILCENDADGITYKKQADYPNPSKLDGDDPYLVYLDVWERHITALEDDDIREKALGGPDTATRTKVVCQVKIDKGDESLKPTGCTAVSKNWDAWVSRWQPANRGSLRARVPPQKNSTDPCLVAPDAKYRGQENQLYRIEIHVGSKEGETGGATVKWSRNNGAVVSKVLSSSGKELAVEKTLGFEPGIWVELSNDEQELRGEPGSLVKLVKVESDRLTLESTISRPTGILATEKWPTKVRRWDQCDDSNLIEGAIPIVEGKGEDEAGWIKIEHGIEIQFVPANGGHQYRTGDFWLIPARVATGDIEWPVEMEAGNKNPISKEREPFGIQHHYASLTILNMGQREPPDCRCKFEPLKNNLVK